MIQGDNAQALVDAKHPILLAAEAFASQDHKNLQPMLAGAKQNLQAIGKDEPFFHNKQLTADSNYHSLHSLTVCQDEKIDAYIPNIRFRKRDERFAEAGRFQHGLHPRLRPLSRPGTFPLSDFTFDAASQTYRCPNGKTLRLHARSQINRFRTYDVYHARPEDCAAYPLRSHCLSKPSASRRYLSVPTAQPPNLLDKMKAKMDTPQGKRIYARRLAIVEPVFANLCVHKRMSRFTLRTKRKVDVQWRLFALVHNIGEIHASGVLN